MRSGRNNGLHWFFIFCECRGLGYALWPEHRLRRLLFELSVEAWDMRSGRNCFRRGSSHACSVEAWDMRSGQIRKANMHQSTKTKSISAVQARAGEFFNGQTGQRDLSALTQKGEPKAALQDVASFDVTQKTLALLKILAYGDQEVVAGSVKPIDEVVARLKTKRPKG